MRPGASIIVVAAVVGSLLALISCGNTSNCTVRHDCPNDLVAGSGNASGANNEGTSGRSARVGDGGSVGDAGADNDAGSAGAAITCDSTLSPDADGCVISDTYGVFVAPTGNDTTGNGTEAAPYATLTAALAKLDQIKRIYVCAAEYVEPSTLEIPSGVAVFGGFGCDGGAWTYDSANNKASFKPQSPIGAEIKNASGVALTDLSITAADATSPGGSSFGVMVVSSEGVALTRVAIKAGKGANGSAGTDGTNGADGADVTVAATGGQNGRAAVCGATADNIGPSWPAASACNVRGGAGGTGYVASDGDPGTTGVPLSNIVADGVKNGGAGAMAPGAAVAGKNGGDGSSGLSGANGAPAKEVGIFSPAGYAAASGGDGTDGFPGQGGGGGGASKGNSANNCTGASGGAGGMAGCGGTHAGGGTGGGASVALLDWNSSLSLVGSALLANNGGSGGKGGRAGTGGTGKVGGQGGAADNTIDVGKGGSGGQGGLGGNGGNGAGGTGGPSISVVYSTEPVIDATSTLTPGTPGGSGVGGSYGNINTKGPDGKVGLAKDRYKVPTQ